MSATTFYNEAIALKNANPWLSLGGAIATELRYRIELRHDDFFETTGDAAIAMQYIANGMAVSVGGMTVEDIAAKAPKRTMHRLATKPFSMDMSISDFEATIPRDVVSEAGRAFNRMLFSPLYISYNHENYSKGRSQHIRWTNRKGEVIGDKVLTYRAGMTAQQVLKDLWGCDDATIAAILLSDVIRYPKAAGPTDAPNLLRRLIAGNQNGTVWSPQATKEEKEAMKKGEMARPAYGTWTAMGHPKTHQVAIRVELNSYTYYSDVHPYMTVQERRELFPTDAAIRDAIEKYYSGQALA